MSTRCVKFECVSAIVNSSTWTRESRTLFHTNSKLQEINNEYKSAIYKARLARQHACPARPSYLPDIPAPATSDWQQCYKPFTSPINVQISKVIYSCRLAIRSTSCCRLKGQHCLANDGRQTGRQATIVAHKAAETLARPSTPGSAVGSVALSVRLSFCRSCRPLVVLSLSLRRPVSNLL